MNAHACRLSTPAATEAQWVSVPTCTGEELLSHAHSVPSVLIATVWLVPAATEAQWVSVPTCTGAGE